MYTRREIGNDVFRNVNHFSSIYKMAGATRYSGILFSAGNKRMEGGGGGSGGRGRGCQLSGNGCSPTFYLKQYPARTAKISAIREFRDEFLLSKTSTSPVKEILLFVRGRMYGRILSYIKGIFLSPGSRKAACPLKDALYTGRK